MKNIPSLTHLSDSTVYKAHQHGSLSPTKAEIKKAFVAIAQTVEEILQDLSVRYYDASDPVQFETDGSTRPWSTEWAASEALHSVENMGDKAIEAIRIELKKA